jgi:methyl-accepting chemotaxis protein
MQTLARFSRSKSGRFLILYLVLAAGISAAVASYFYSTSLQSFLAQKAAEKATALKLVDAFVTTYSRLRSQFGANAPVPATFRAQSIDSFNKELGSNSAFLLRWVGREGRQIATPPVDAEMANAIESFVTARDRSPRSELRIIDNRQVLRTIYPSLANEQGCVTCHNQLQPNNIQWRLNDVMGAFAIDIPVASFLQGFKIQSYTVALGLFMALATIGLAVSILHFRQSNERERAASQLRMQNIRFDAALNNMSQGLCMFDANKRLVVCNERYAAIYRLPAELVEPGTLHDDIITHRIKSGILGDDRTDQAVKERLSALSRLSTEQVSTRIDKFADGRMIKVTRGPLPGGGWVATHEDVTQQAQHDSIDSAIASFRQRVESVLKTVGECTQAMKSTATKLSGSSEQTSLRAKGISQASQAASANVENAAVATRQMLGSATEIGQQIEQTSKMVHSAVSKVKATNDEFVGLSNAAQKIGAVINLIQQISQQTNLLALNATIESARAGDAGRGFAVVASEVKSLALQTGKATEEVADQILAVQASTTGAIQAVGSIEACIGEISTYTSAVAGSIDEQSAATLKISNNVANAAQETSKFATVLAEVAEAVIATRGSADIVLTASESVEGAVENLRREIETFLGNVAA